MLFRSRAAEFEVIDLELPDWDTGTNCFVTIYFSELWESDHALVEYDPEGVGPDIAQMVGMANLFQGALDDSRHQLEEWRRAVFDLFEQVEVLALPTLPIFPPRLVDLGSDITPTTIEITRHTSLFNAAGTPCSAQPVPAAGSPLPASLQLVGPMGAEELLLATAQVLEAAVSRVPPKQKAPDPRG